MKTTCKLLFGCFILFVASFTIAQQMDAKLNLAKRALIEIEDKFELLQSGDNAQYNVLSEQLGKTAELLQTTESKAHPDYITSIQKWSALRQSMVTKAAQWQALSANVQTTVSNKTEHPTGAKQLVNPDDNSSVANPDKILAKYQRENRPKLPDYPNPSEVTEWAKHMLALQTDELQQDIALLQNVNIDRVDANRVERWISGNFQQQIQQDVDTAMQSFNSSATMAVELAMQLQSILANDNADKATVNSMRAYNLAQGDTGRENSQTLQNGLVACANGQALEAIFPSQALSTRVQQIGKIAIAQQQLETLIEQASVTTEKLASQPKKQKPKKAVFIKGIAQKIWYRGSELASLDNKGSIWMKNRDIGDITSNGTIWVNGNDLGSIETNGKVWFRGNHIGTLEESGKVWRNGTQVGLVEADGTVWVDGNKNGEIIPFEGEWKRAAILYYFSDIFYDN